MPYTPMGSLSQSASLEELRDYIIRLERKLDFLQQNLDTENIFEVGGWRVTSDQLASKDGDVGMSTADTGGDDVRFWAGSTSPETAPFRIRKSGKGTLTGINIQSSETGYPRVVLSTEDDTVGVYFAADKYILLKATSADNTPVIELTNGSNGATIMMDGSTFSLQVNGDLALVNTGDIFFTTTGSVIFDSWDVIKNLALPGVPSLQQSLNEKAKVASYNGGIPIGTSLATSDGGSFTWAGINLTS